MQKGRGLAKLAETQRRRQNGNLSPRRRIAPTSINMHQDTMVLPGVAVVIEINGEENAFLFDGDMVHGTKLHSLSSVSPLGSQIDEKYVNDSVTYNVAGEINSATVIQIVCANDAVQFVTDYYEKRVADEIAAKKAEVLKTTGIQHSRTATAAQVLGRFLRSPSETQARA